MKIQFYGGNQFTIEASEGIVTLNAQAQTSESTAILALSIPALTADSSASKTLSLPGEYEVSGILAQGFYLENRSRVAYKFLAEETCVAYFSGITEVPMTDFFEKLGENVDVVILELSTDFPAEKAKNLLEKIEPRLAILSGDAGSFPKAVELLSAKLTEESSFEVKKSQLPEDKTEVMILAAV